MACRARHCKLQGRKSIQVLCRAACEYVALRQGTHSKAEEAFDKRNVYVGVCMLGGGPQPPAAARCMDGRIRLLRSGQLQAHMSSEHITPTSNGLMQSNRLKTRLCIALEFILTNLQVKG